MSKCSITIDLVGSSDYANFNKANTSMSIQDVATLVETFEVFLEEGINPCLIEDVLTDGSYYLFVVGLSQGNFDFYAFINKYYHSDFRVTCINVRWLFPRSLSRGILPSIQVTAELDEDESPTGYMDDSEISNDVIFYLYHSRLNVSTKISTEGLTVGRSSSNADYVVRGNNNVSRKHCILYKDGIHVRMHTCRTPNGTFVNGKRVSDETDIYLNIGDTLLLADEEFTIK